LKVVKYLPYGPTEYLIPYLMRRGHESKQVMREHLFTNELSNEIKSRLNPVAKVKGLGISMNIFKKKPKNENPTKPDEKQSNK